MIALTWNLEHGRGDSHWRNVAAEVGADVVLLQEASAPTALGEPEWRAVPGRSWGSAIVVTNGALTSLAVPPEYVGWVSAAVWHWPMHLGRDGIHTFSVHAPTRPKTERRGTYVREVRDIVDWIHDSTPEGVPLLIGGDFNFRSFGERVESEIELTTQAEIAALSDFRENKGLLVAWRDLNPNCALPQTLRWTGDRTIPFHCDGFLTRGLQSAELTCAVLEAERFHVSSDHYPVTLSCVNPSFDARAS